MSGQAVRLEPGPGRTLRDLLFERGVEFPCGGTTMCGGCRVRVLDGAVAATPEMGLVLTDRELADGWRLGCLAEAAGSIVVEVAQWSAAILEDRTATPFVPGTGVGAVVDLGTTTLVAQAVDLANGAVLAVSTALNPQARHGADLMARVRFEQTNPGVLTALIRATVGGLLRDVSGSRPLAEVLLVGNTVMHHLFAGRSVEPLAAVPFRTPHGGAAVLDAAELGWDLRLEGPATVLPCIGGFVGSDVLAGLIATGLHDVSEPGALLDLGTNGEIAVADSTGIVCASTAAGPAFEGGRIGQGQRAGSGAIDRVRVEQGALVCSVIGGIEPRGICGSGLVDAVAAARGLGWIEPSGRLARPHRSIPLAGGVALNQSDIRELQLAKGAIAAGFGLLLQGRRLCSDRVFLAGAFGNYIHAPSARRIGLLPSWVENPTAAGNSALRGARLLLLAADRRAGLIDQTLARARHVELATNPAFLDAFVDAMAFPEED